MKVAVVGSRNITNISIKDYLPASISLIISGGAKGIDALAENYADSQQIKKLIFHPEYKKYGKSAPLVRNRLIVENADLIIALWDGKSRGTKHTIDYAVALGKKVSVYIIK